MKTKTFNFHNFNRKIKPAASNRLIIILILMLFAGLIIGSLIIKTDNNVIPSMIIKTYTAYSDIDNCANTAALFFRIFLFTSSIILLIYFTGLCAVGIPFVSVLPFITGVFAGVIAGYYYKTFLLKGLGYCMIIFFPAMIIFETSILLSCRESIKMSQNMLNLLSMRHNQTNMTFKSYSLKFLIYIVSGGLSSLVFAVLSKLFIRLF